MNTKEFIAFLVLHVAVTIASNGTKVLAETSDGNWTEDAVTNVARHKETLQSHLSQYDSSLVVDGSTDQLVANGSCINIEKKGGSWWQVDLGDIYTIFNVRVFLAKDCCDDIRDIFCVSVKFRTSGELITLVENEHCYSTPWHYRGKANTTVSGRSCQSWDDLQPKHTHIRWFFTLRDMIENYCRASVPFFWFSHQDQRSVKPWCYSTDPNVTWEFCDIEQCERYIFHDLNLKTGTQVKTLEIPDFKDIIDHPRHIREFVLPDNSRSRYVEFHQDGTADYYPLCEVEVYGVKDYVTNVALRKTAQMSTESSEHLLDDSLVIDGNLDQNMLKDSCFLTEEEDNPWWRVDLTGIYVIFLVRFYRHQDCCNLVHDVQLQEGTSLDTMFDAGVIEGQIETIQNIVLPRNIEARFVELLLKGPGALHLCEVEVFGKKAECKYDPCQNGGNCSVVYCGELDNCRNYTCACEDGFGGIDCEVCTYNVAVGKHIEASSIYHKTWLPSNVIDGDNNQNVMFGATCVSTQKEIKPYLMLDLGDEYNITGVNVYRRMDCCQEDTYAIELFLFVSKWTSFGNTSGLIEGITKFDIYPYVATRHVKLMETDEYPTFLQLCEIEVFSICHEDFTMTSSSPQTMVDQPMPFIQMRFSLSDKYSEVVKSEDSFKYLILQGLSSQTGYSVESFRNIQTEKDPFRVAFELHATDGNRVTLNEMLKKIDTLNRFGILEIENEDGQLLSITAGSLQYHMLVLGNKGTRIGSPFLLAVSIIVTVITCI